MLKVNENLGLDQAWDFLDRPFFEELEHFEPYYAGERKTKVTKGPPEFRPEAWMIPEVRNKTNCLTYAMDLIDRGESNPGFLRMPVVVTDEDLAAGGQYADRPYMMIDSFNISAAFHRKGLEHDNIVQIPEHGGRDDDHIIAMFYAQEGFENGSDFDAYQKNKGGVWTRAQVRGPTEMRDIVIETCSYAFLASLISHSWENCLLKKHAQKRKYPEFLGFFKMPDEFEYYPDPELVKLGLDGV